MAANLPIVVVQKILRYASGSPGLVREIFKAWALKIELDKCRRLVNHLIALDLEQPHSSYGSSSSSSSSNSSPCGVKTPDELFDDTDDGFD